MARSGDRFVQVGERGQIFTSTDLETWRLRDSGTRRDLRAVTVFNDRWIVTGEAGTVVRADDRFLCEVLDLRTSDWLEGVAASGDRVVAVGDNGAVFASSDGAFWERHPQSFDAWLRGVAWGNGVFVAVGEAGFTATSSDGVTWRARSLGVSVHFNRVRFLNDRFMAVGDDGVVIESPGGENWSAVPSRAAFPVYDVAANGATRLWCGDEELWAQSGENAVWVNQLDAAMLPYPAPVWTYLTALSLGETFLVAGRTGLMAEGSITSRSAETVWWPGDDSVRNWLWSVHRTPELYVAVGDYATILTSSDGIDWDLEVTPESVVDNILLGVGGTLDVLVAAGNAGTLLHSTNRLTEVVRPDAEGDPITALVSTLGVVWEAVEPRPTENDLQGVAARAGLIVVTGGNGTVLTSADGMSWTLQPAPTQAFLGSVAVSPTAWVAVGDQGTILRSSDAQAWEVRPSGTAAWLTRVRYLDEEFIALGENGVILTSADGVAWTPRATGDTRWLNDVVRADGRYFAVGNQGAVLESSDARTWRAIDSITHKSLYGAATFGDRLVLVGIEGVILHASLRPVLTPVGILEYDRIVAPEGATASAFLFQGVPDQPFTLDGSEDLTTWSTRDSLEIVDGSGLLLHFETSDSSEAPPREFYRTGSMPEN